MASSKELPGENDGCQQDNVDLYLLEHCTSLQVRNIHSRASGREFLEFWYLVPQHCPLGSHTIKAPPGNRFLQTRLLFLPLAEWPLSLQQQEHWVPLTTLHHISYNVGNLYLWLMR